MDLKETKNEGVDWTQLAQDRVQWRIDTLGLHKRRRISWPVAGLSSPALLHGISWS